MRLPGSALNLLQDVCLGLGGGGGVVLQAVCLGVGGVLLRFTVKPTGLRDRDENSRFQVVRFRVRVQP